MAEEAEVEGLPRILFTAPWQPVVVRRGDALGLRALADQLADAVAPGLSNRVRDGRWVTILAWCLARSQEVFHASRGRSVHTRAEQLERYGWLRPLELMWVGRTIALADDWRERSLAGQRRVRPWYEDDEQSTDRFGMSPDQFRAYRQTGMYGSPFGPDALVVTDKLSEGIDLHRYCRHLIHYELDPSPIRTVQRNGRLRRVNSWAAVTGQPILYAFPAFRGTRDYHLVRIMKKRIDSFSLLLGGVQDFDVDEVVGSEEKWRNEVIALATSRLEKTGRGLRARKRQRP